MSGLDAYVRISDESVIAIIRGDRNETVVYRFENETEMKNKLDEARDFGKIIHPCSSINEFNDRTEEGRDENILLFIRGEIVKPPRGARNDESH